ncbi:MAG: hypothetical protein M3Y56_13725 [Armatimonadota bacterium]|nr:hypothetical protein [Armatimonadota bacterium]
MMLSFLAPKRIAAIGFYTSRPLLLTFAAKAVRPALLSALFILSASIATSQTVPPGAIAPSVAGMPAAPPLPFPSPAGPPDAAGFRTMLRVLAGVPAIPLPRQPVAVSLEDDTLTGGSWLGRRGRYWANLCAMVSSGNYVWGGGWEIVDSGAGLGPDIRAGDGLRHWVTQLYTTEPRSLEMPYPYLQTRVDQKLTTWDVNRRQSEYSDHGETYPMTQEGPDLYLGIRVPPGWYTLSFYDFNKDGHTNVNRYRDYAVSIRSRPYRDNVASIEGFDASAELAHSRLHDFWGGVWKRFLVHGPAVYTVRLDRNNSLNTILAGTFLDTLDEFPPPYRSTPEQRLLQQNEDRKRVVQEQIAGAWKYVPAAASGEELADLLLERLEDLQLTNAEWWAVNSRRFYLPLLRFYRAQANGATPHPKRLASAATCSFRLGLFSEWEAWQKKQGLQLTREIEQHLRLNSSLAEDQRQGSGHEFEIASDYVASQSAAGP